MSMNRYEALKHAVKAHAGQKDKGGRDYILHPIAVAEAVGEPYEVIALLHDVWEDTDYKLYRGGFSREQWEALSAITRWEPDTHAEYIEKVCRHPAACYVKLADLWHNLSPERQDCLPGRERKGLEKRYLKARARIWEALGYEWWPGSEGA